MDKHVEILQVSSLEDCPWPLTDPHEIAQRTRSKTNRDLELVRLCLQSARINPAAFDKNIKKMKLSKSETILRIICHEKFQMNGRFVREESRWKQCVDYAINKNIPIEIVYPQFCVIPNAPKRYTNQGPAAGEDCTIEFFKFINEHVKRYHKPGIKIHALADASLYASAFQTHQTEVDGYYCGLERRIQELDAQDCIELHDYASLLRTECHPDYQKLYYAIGKNVWAGNIEELLPNTHIPTLRRSVRCSVNTRRFQLGHKDHLSLFGPTEHRNTSHPFWDKIEALTEFALREVITIRLACTEIDIASRLWPNAIRASCHKGQKSGRWAVGLRTYPEYFGSCKLLPYHGMPIIKKSKKNKIKLAIEPEVLLRSRNDLIRVTIGHSDEVYAYIEEGVENEFLLEDMDYVRPKGMRTDEFEIDA